MEFHISRAIREKLEMDGLLFSYTGNVVFADVAASRKLANRLNESRVANHGPDSTVNAGALFGMGLIDELNHALVAHYRNEIDPAVLSDALAWFAARIGPEKLDGLLLAFVEQFPNVAVYQGRVTASEWLRGSTEGLANREAALEELMLLWVTNLNPAFVSFRELFDDHGLKEKTPYPNLTAELPGYLESRPPFSHEVGSLFEVLRAPILASPDSLSGQLEFIREHWPKYLGPELPRVLLAIDVLREEDVAIWMRFNPPSPDRFGHAAPGFGGEGFVGDEYVGFDQEFGGEYFIGPDGVRHRRYAHGYQAPLHEYEAFSADQAWMPNVVLIAKSTYVWLEQLSKKYGRYIQYLSDIPDEELRLLAERGITGLWLIGLWERSIASRTIKRLRGHGDAVASAYSLKDYNIAEDLGGGLAYANLRDRAAAVGLRLASDMVPNHMGIDSTWVIEHPDWFLSKPDSPFPSYSFNGPDISPDSRVEIKIEDHYYDQSDAAVVFRLRHHHEGRTRFVYHGNDGTSFAWNDTAQLDYSQRQVREDVIQTILHVARQFPIIRFDAAMVLAKRHVQRLWFPLPGAGGSIPSRAEDAISQEAFDALMPHEFWREVVDRVAAEVPGTLLLAEAFWLLEGYFVRTLGMHRVYNSAFMNMLRDEENAKYRSYLKKTLEFDPDILKRYVNFMSNPDERTTIDQFGDGDKNFGVCTLLSTLPGLPMFAHGQIEGYTERYGMEFKQAKMEEYPNEGMMARHQHDIAPLLKNRRLFAESANFVLYDFWTEHGSVDENVFAYSNRLHDQRALIFYNNRYEGTQGTIHMSVAAMDKESGSLRQTSLAHGLALPFENSLVLAYRDVRSGLEYLRRATDVHHHGLSLALQGYQTVVLLHWREFHSTAEHPWDRLCDSLAGRGVPSVDDALLRLRFAAVHDALKEAVSPAFVNTWMELAEEPAKPIAAIAPEPQSNVLPMNERPELPESESQSELPEVEGSSEQSGLVSSLEVVAEPSLKLSLEPGLKPFLESCQKFLKISMEHLPAEFAEAVRPQSTSPGATATGADAPENAAETRDPEDLDIDLRLNSATLARAARQLPRLIPESSTAWPAAARLLVPGSTKGIEARQAWTRIAAWVVLHSLASKGKRTAAFDQLHLRFALAEIFSSTGLAGEGGWWAAAQVRLLLRQADRTSSSLDTEAFWNDPDVRWLAGVNESDGIVYFNRERFEEMVCWLQLPEFFRIAATVPVDLAGLQLLETTVAEVCLSAERSSYQLKQFLTAMSPDTLEGRTTSASKS